MKDEDRREKFNSDNEDINTLVVSTAARTAAKTLMYLFVFAAFFAAMVSLIFPYEAMKVYRDFGNDERARECIVMQLNMTESVDKSSTFDYKSLYYAQNIDHINLTIKMMNDATKFGLYSRESIEASGYVSAAVTKYLGLQDNGLRSAMIDEFNLRNSSYKWHANLYGYDSFIRTTLFKARTILGDLAYIDKAKLQQVEVVNGDTIGDIIQLLGYLTTEKSIFGKAVELINTDKIEKYLIEDEPIGVEKLFWLRTLIEYRQVFKQPYQELASKYAKLLEEYGSLIKSSGSNEINAK